MTETRCDCRPTEGYHQYHCVISRRMRADLREGKRPEPINPQERAKLRVDDSGMDERCILKRGCIYTAVCPDHGECCAVVRCGH